MYIVFEKYASTILAGRVWHEVYRPTPHVGKADSFYRTVCRKVRDVSESLPPFRTFNMYA